ncbi:MAG: DUF4860 domain-containing protein [Lachnospiraceae bacterium]|nr:DUF4860 domain-containing protein [Lachnospiraceae bacterium]MDE7285475.1 DUF4860 domain-containing protein [Lachnospiraceae bacterium]
MEENQQKHIIDTLFVIALFCLFALSAIFLITIGANIYGRTINNMENNFNSRTALAYITEKVRQSDSEDSISTGTFQECPALIITSRIEDTEYLTYLYEYNGYIKEIMVRKGMTLDPAIGQDIIAVSDFSLAPINDHLINCTITIDEMQSYHLYISVHSGGLTNEK